MVYTWAGVSRQRAEDSFVVEGRIVVLFEFGTLSSMLIRLFTCTLERHTLWLQDHGLRLRRRRRLRDLRLGLGRRSIHHGGRCRANSGIHRRLRLKRMFQIQWLCLRWLLLQNLGLRRRGGAGALGPLSIRRGTANRLPGPSSSWTRPSSDGIQGRVDLPGVVTHGAICLSLLLCSAETLEVLAGTGISRITGSRSRAQWKYRMCREHDVWEGGADTTRSIHVHSMESERSGQGWGIGDGAREMKGSGWHERSHGKAEWLSRDEGRAESSRIKLTGIPHL